jgi:hypothetical protein
LLASFALGRFTVVALSGDPPLARALPSPAQVDFPIVLFWLALVGCRESPRTRADGACAWDATIVGGQADRWSFIGEARRARGG